jgi:hypothetical protein
MKGTINTYRYSAKNLLGLIFQKREKGEKGEKREGKKNLQNFFLILKKTIFIKTLV